MRLKIVLLLFLLLPSIIFAQNIDVQTTGTCRDFTIIIDTDLSGCWDAKAEIPGSVLHPDGWKSSFFYVDNAVCNGSGELQVRTGTNSDITATMKLRQNSTVLEKDFAIRQSCAEISGTESLFVAVAVIIFLALGIAIYLKRPKTKRRRR